jgi:hypothetical protein
MKLFLGLALSLLISATSFGDQKGSFFLSDISDLFAQENGLGELLKRSFDIYSVGDASRIGSADNQQLDGTRVGPYHLFAKPKGKAGPFIYEICIETNKSFVDLSGKEVSMAQAAAVKETLKLITLRPLKPTDYFSPSPD